MKYGLFWGIGLVVLYILSYVSFGMYLVYWASQWETADGGWSLVYMLLSFVAHVIVGGFLFPVVLGIALWMIWKDKTKWDTFQKFIPLFAGFLYTLLPVNVPGFLDEILVLGIASVVNWVYLKLRRTDRSSDLDAR